MTGKLVFDKNVKCCKILSALLTSFINLKEVALEAQEREGARKEFSSMETEKIRTVYQKLAMSRSGVGSPTIREEVAGEILDERDLRTKLSRLDTEELQGILVTAAGGKGEKKEMTLEERIILDILAERNPAPLE